jgi:hypothetical protein
MNKKIFFWVSVVVVLGVTLLVTSREAYSQGANCAPLGTIEDALLNDFGEVRKYEARMETPDGLGTGFFTYLNPETGTWTFVMLMPHPSGELVGCVMGNGDKWKEITKVTKKNDTKA